MASSLRVPMLLFALASFACRSHPLTGVAGVDAQPTDTAIPVYTAMYVPLDGDFIRIGTSTPTNDLCVTLLINRGPAYGGNGDLALPVGWAVNAVSLTATSEACLLGSADAWPANASGSVGGPRFPCALDVDVELVPRAQGDSVEQAPPSSLPERVTIVATDLETANYPGCAP